MSTISNPNSLNGERKQYATEPIFAMVYPSNNDLVGVNNNRAASRANSGGGSVSSKGSSEYYDGASAPPRLIPIEKRVKKKKVNLKALESSITRLVVVVVLALIVILACMIPVLYFLGDTAQLFKRYQNRMSQTTVITKDPFKLKELEDLLNEITSHAKMTGGENERLRLLVNNSNLFGYCTKNVPASACLPCACTPHNKLNNEYSCDCTNLQPKKDCKAFFESGFRVDGVYTLQPDGSKNNVSVFCDQTSDRGGWEVIQRRRDGSTGFHRDWNEYELGFGDVHRDFYLGNEKIHLLTKTQKQLFIKMTDFNGRTYSALYDKFHVADNTQKYRLNCSALIWGNVGDNFCQFHSGMYFSSYDSDNDKRSQMNCAAGSAGGGGWWYSNCYGANLNGVYYQTRRQDSNGIKWSGVDSSNTLKKVEMKIRRP